MADSNDLAWTNVVEAIIADDPTHLRHWIDLDPENIESTQHLTSEADHDVAPMITASKFGSTKCMQVLIEAGAQVNVIDTEGRSAMHWAADHNHKEIVQQLLSTCECVDKVDTLGKTARDLALAKQHKDMATLLDIAGGVAPCSKPETLLKKEVVTPELKGTVVKIPVLQMLFGNYTLRFMDENAQYVDKDVKLLQNENEGEHYEIIGTLKGPRYSIVHLAAATGDTATTQKLLEVGCDVDYAAEGGVTALWLAADGGHEKCLHLLVEAGGLNINPCADSGAIDAWMLGLGLHKRQMLVMAYHWMWTDEAVRMWGGQRGPEEVKNGATPLFLSGQQGTADSMSLLIVAGAAVEARAEGDLTVLGLVALQGFDDCLKLLIDNGADVNTPTEEGVTPLISAAKLGSLSCVRLLLDAGASINSCTYDEKHTALHEAALCGHRDVVLLLLSTCACKDVVNHRGLMARDLALENKEDAVALILQLAGSVAPWKEPASLCNRAIVVEGMSGGGGVGDQDSPEARLSTTSISSVTSNLTDAGAGPGGEARRVGWVINAISSWTTGHTHSVLFEGSEAAEDVKLLRDKNSGFRYVQLRTLAPLGSADPRFDPAMRVVGASYNSGGGGGGRAQRTMVGGLGAAEQGGELLSARVDTAEQGLVRLAESRRVTASCTRLAGEMSALVHSGTVTRVLDSCVPKLFPPLKHKTVLVSQTALREAVRDRNYEVVEILLDERHQTAAAEVLALTQRQTVLEASAKLRQNLLDKLEQINTSAAMQEVDSVIVQQVEVEKKKKRKQKERQEKKEKERKERQSEKGAGAEEEAGAKDNNQGANQGASEAAGEGASAAAVEQAEQGSEEGIEKDGHAIIAAEIAAATSSEITTTTASASAGSEGGGGGGGESEGEGAGSGEQPANTEEAGAGAGAEGSVPGHTDGHCDQPAALPPRLIKMEIAGQCEGVSVSTPSSTPVSPPADVYMTRAHEHVEELCRNLEKQLVPAHFPEGNRVERVRRQLQTALQSLRTSTARYGELLQALQWKQLGVDQLSGRAGAEASTSDDGLGHGLKLELGGEGVGSPLLGGSPLLPPVPQRKAMLGSSLEDCDRLTAKLCDELLEEAQQHAAYQATQAKNVRQLFDCLHKVVTSELEEISRQQREISDALAVAQYLQEQEGLKIKRKMQKDVMAAGKDLKRFAADSGAEGPHVVDSFFEQFERFLDSTQTQHITSKRIVGNSDTFPAAAESGSVQEQEHSLDEDTVRSANASFALQRLQACCSTIQDAKELYPELALEYPDLPSLSQAVESELKQIG